MIFRRLAPLLTSLLVIMLATMTRGTTMSSAYTNWPTDNAPPNTIVLAMIPVDPVSGGPLSGCVRMDGYPSNLILNFNDDYLAHVLPNEWPNPSPQQGYQAG